VRVAVGSIVVRAPYRFVASAETWLKRRRRAREDRRRDQSYLGEGKGKGKGGSVREGVERSGMWACV
jgi:hypothetical protein